MGAAPVPKFVRSLALHFPDICPQFFLGNFIRQKEKNYTQHCIFSGGCLPVNTASKTVIRFSALLPMCFVNKRPHSNIMEEYGCVSIEVHLHLIAHTRTVFPHYKNSGLISMWVHKFFKGMISSSNFVEIARLVVLARKDPGTTSTFSSVLDPLP